jgi:hypothetical protein
MTTGLEFTEQVLCTNHNNTENTVERHTLCSTGKLQCLKAVNTEVLNTSFLACSGI